MPPPGRKSLNHKARVDDSDSEGDDGRLPKYEQIQPQYLNQPIDHKLGESKLKALILDLGNLSKYLKQSASTLYEVAGDVSESLSRPEDEEPDYDDLPEDPDEIKQLDKEYRAVLDKIQEVKIRQQVLSDTRQRLVQSHEISNIFDVYEKGVEGPLATYQNQTMRQRFLQNTEYRSFRTLIFESLYNGAAVPSMKKLIPAEADDSDDDDEIEVGAQTEDFKCPLTMRLLENPHSSTKCPHSYSGAAIFEMLRQSNKCPVAGCSARLTVDDIEPNEGLKRRVEAHARREKEHGPAGTQKGKSGPTYEVMSDDEEDED